MPFLELRDVAFGYEKTNLFNNINLSLDVGELCCLVGPNGCGKTTLLDCTMNIHKIRKGAIFLAGRDIASYKRHELAREVAYVPQVHDKTFPYTVLQMVLMGRSAYTGIFGSPNKEDEKIALQALCDVGMESYVNRPYTKLSGGEMQLILLARALAQKTDLIIMDEPTSHLDFKNELMFLETMIKLCRNLGTAVLMATHMPNHAFYFASEGLPVSLAMMHQGTISNYGLPDEVLTEENIRKVYSIDAKIIMDVDINGRELKSIVLRKTLQ